MRHLTLAAALLVTGIAAASTAGADPTGTPATPTPSATATPTASDAPAATTAAPTSTSTAPTSTAPTSTAPTSTAPTSTAPTSTSAAVPAGAHQVTYTVTTTSDLTANIYYVSADPPDQAAANTPQYMPMARTQVGPGAPWTVQATLTDPTKWAFVSASGGLRVNPEFHCEIAVDGQVVVSQQGGSGVQCALRPR
jgi:hypothetical protein